MWVAEFFQCCAGSQKSSPVPAPLLDREQTAKFLAKKLPAPSSYAKQKKRGWQEDKDLQVLLRTHRPAQPEGDPFQQLPVALLDKTLGQVEEDCAHAVPSAEDVDFAQALMHAMSGSFTDEGPLVVTFWKMIREEFGVAFDRLTMPNGVTDGSLLVALRQGAALYANLEVKQDIGSGGGDPRLQNCCYAAHHFCRDYHSELRWLSRCPTLLLELAGPNLSLSGFAFGEHACCDQLSQTVSLLWQPKSELMLGAPRLVYALRHALPALQVRYQRSCS